MAEKNENTERNEKEEKFQAKLKELLALAKKKKNVLEYQEISDFFQRHGTECRSSLRRF